MRQHYIVNIAIYYIIDIAHIYSIWTVLQIYRLHLLHWKHGGGSRHSSRPLHGHLALVAFFLVPCQGHPEYMFVSICVYMMEFEVHVGESLYTCASFIYTSMFNPRNYMAQSSVLQCRFTPLSS